ncbi:MAG TPA: SpoIIE family protein phosphatase [Thermoanaerobaculia bacterium]|nr:SpoIIE family protein phosphatase [Thermoanaerobaculia bacterium]
MPGEPRTVRFTVYQPNLAPTRVSLPIQTITLGRASDCTIPIRDRFLSRKHAEINYASGKWVVRDCGSVNGTLLNGTKLSEPSILRPGDRILLGDSEVVFDSADSDAPPQFIPIDSDSHAKSLVLPLRDAIADLDRSRERTAVLASLAVQFIEDRPMEELFEFILDRVVALLSPSRAAIALLGPDKKTFDDVRLRRSNTAESSELSISRTLLGEVVEERNVVSFVDTAQDEKLARAESIIGQHIRSAVCAPLIVNDVVTGVLYLDFLANRGAITHEDVRLIAQIARLAALKLDTTRLREEAIAKAKIDEELRTAYTIQSRLLPSTLPVVDNYCFAGTNKPCKTVSGDYYDVVVRPDGRLYFIVADVSGKGITAALVMSGLATAFNIFTRTDPTPADLVRELNLTLAPKTSPTKFATLVAGVLDPKSGHVEFANAGHVPPLVVTKSGVQRLESTDLVIGLFTHAQYRNQTITLEQGDSLVLFTDGVTEAENKTEDQLGLEPVEQLLAHRHGSRAPDLMDDISAHVQSFMGDCAPLDDITLFVMTRAS